MSKKKKSKKIKEFTECTLRGMLGFDCKETYQDKLIEQSKSNNPQVLATNNPEVLYEYMYGPIIEEALGIFPEDEFKKLVEENSIPLKINEYGELRRSNNTV